MKLTLKQDNFCLAYIETGDASEAYRRAYDASRMNKESVNRKAHDLMINGKVTARIAELRRPVVEAVQITLAAHLNDLKRLRDDALAAEKYGPAIQAEIARGKASGLYIDRIEAGGPGDFERLEDDELERRIAENQHALRLTEATLRAAAAPARKITAHK